MFDAVRPTTADAMKPYDSETLQRLRGGKQHLRKQRLSMSLPEKVQQVVELQKVVLPAIRRRRPLRAWESVWKLRR